MAAKMSILIVLYNVLVYLETEEHNYFTGIRFIFERLLFQSFAFLGIFSIPILCDIQFELF